MKHIKYTTSVCPQCLKHLKAEVREGEGKIFLARTCPEHGAFECDLCYHQYCQRHMLVTIGREKLCGFCHLNLPVLDYEDGGELECGVCRKPCRRHYRQHGMITVGECCTSGEEVA